MSLELLRNLLIFVEDKIEEKDVSKILKALSTLLKSEDDKALPMVSVVLLHAILCAE